MKKQLFAALFTLSLIGVNLIPAQAEATIISTCEDQETGEMYPCFCVHIPGSGETCKDLR